MGKTTQLAQVLELAMLANTTFLQQSNGNASSKFVRALLSLSGASYIVGQIFCVPGSTTS